MPAAALISLITVVRVQKSIVPECKSAIARMFRSKITRKSTNT